jgi:methylenetetrahydrofolate dehydrogenase (NADP+)/methenyltetrahydrofolate cyclohydrolase
VTATIIDGRAVAAALRAEVAGRAAAFTARHGRPPGLATVLAGNDPASHVYVRSKRKQAVAAGLADMHRSFPADVPEAELLAEVERLNGDEAVDGILVQLPLPPQVDAGRVLALLDPAKDVDGLTAISAGRLASGLPGLRPCTPSGCIKLLGHAGVAVAGARAVVIGRSNLVGRPVAQLLLLADATVTIAHSRTRDLAFVCAEADVLIAAVGRPELVRGDWVKPGAAVIDVGINRLPDGRLTGDVAYAEAAERAGWITPVPGGVGPMTIACLLENTVIAAEARARA